MLKLGDQRAVGVEKFFGLVAAEPLFDLAKTMRIGDGIKNGNLVSAPKILDLVAVDFFGAGPTFGRAKNDHGPTRASGVVIGAGVLLDGTNIENALLESGGHFLMHDGGIVALDEVGIVAVADEKRFEFIVRYAGEDSGIGDFVAIEMEDGKNGAIANGIEKFIGVPGGGERAGFGFTIANGDGDDEIGIIECGAVAVGEGVAEFATFVNGARSFGSAVGTNAAGERKLAEEFEHACFVATFVWIDFGIVALEIGIGEGGGSAVAGAGNVEDIEIVFFDEAIEMDPDEGLAGIGTPVAEKAILDVLRLERLAEKRVGAKIDHAGGKIVAGAPVGVHLGEFIVRERGKKFGGSSSHDVLQGPLRSFDEGRGRVGAEVRE